MLRDEDELQQALGTSSPEIKWSFAPKRRVRKHSADVFSLINDPSITVIYCRCGWGASFGPMVRMTEAERAFAEHVL